ncbi:unnamed protein product [Anisakis simplex]|uniref:Transposase n=1 Tax=Anisakis simplex TaxID=6269 RepID=A0A0M3JIN3_ANISI|nr:unnamed protein product [Anisakis simplex]
MRSSALKQAGIDRQTDGIGQGECAQGPDPFEIPTTVKRIAYRNRYSQLLAEEMKERLAVSISSV